MNTQSSIRGAATLPLLLWFLLIASASAQRVATDVNLLGRYVAFPSGFASEASVRVSSPDGVNFRARGSFAGQNRFDLPGVVLERNGDVLGLEFVGTLELVNPPNGVAKGTRTPMTLHILLGPTKEAKGVYHLGKILPAIQWDQYGSMNLSRVALPRP